MITSLKHTTCLRFVEHDEHDLPDEATGSYFLSGSFYRDGSPGPQREPLTEEKKKERKKERKKGTRREQRDVEAARCGRQGRQGVSKLSLVAKGINSWKERRASGERKGRKERKKERKKEGRRGAGGAREKKKKMKKKKASTEKRARRNEIVKRRGGTDVGRCFYERRAVCVDVNYIGGHGR